MVYVSYNRSHTKHGVCIIQQEPYKAWCMYHTTGAIQSMVYVGGDTPLLIVGYGSGDVVVCVLVCVHCFIFSFVTHIHSTINPQ